MPFTIMFKLLILGVVFYPGKLQSTHETNFDHCFRNVGYDFTPVLRDHCSSNLTNNRFNKSELFSLCGTCYSGIYSHVSDFLLITVASNATDGFKRFLRSAEVYEVPTKVLGMGDSWKGGDMKGPGGGYKVNLLKEALKEYSNDNSKIVMFTDSYDVIITGPAYEIVEQFEKLDARIVFAAEKFCWPDEKLADKYPFTESKYKYLNSGGFIGYASDLYDFISSTEIADTDDDQLFYTKLFLDKPTREKYRIMLDYKASIFQNLFHTTDDIEIDFEKSAIKNIVYNTKPLVVHGNGPSKINLFNFGNYLANSWDPVNGCLVCNEHNIDLEKIDEADYPEVVIGVFVTQATPFIQEFFVKLLVLDYPKNKLRLFVYNSVQFHAPQIEKFINSVRSKSEFLSIKEIKPEDEMTEANARTSAVDYCLAKECDYFFNIDSLAHLDNPQTLKSLIKLNRTIIAPMLVRPYKAWSNFWGSINGDGFYQRSFDYMDIVNNDRRGIWNVPYVSSAYLLNSSILRKHKPFYKLENLDPDMSFAQYYRNQGVFMFVTNLFDYGHLIDPEAYDISRTNPDMYEIFTNRLDWEQRYIHPDFAENFNPEKVPQQPCPDVYWFPVVTPEFCKQLIEIVEAYGKWSDGSNQDERLVGGYENVPTRDIHMNQVGYESAWMEFLRLFVRPLQEHVFTGYYHDPPRSLMNFVVRYKPDEQPSLRPHHDSSTYTINLALNTPIVDYEGGGCKFIRYNCSVTSTKLGWLLMHPGRLTHYHEGLQVVKGIRYIMISFVDP